jgi:L-asparaginase
MKIVFIQTGGTIDKDYPHTTKGWAFEFGEPATRRILSKLKPSFDYEVITAFQKDSQEITTEDRISLRDLIINHQENKFIITHGTDTMVDTATFLSECGKDKLIILTGSMRPEKFSDSDAPVNLGCAIATANLMENGVYIAMHGIVKMSTEIKRNPVTGQFY